MLSWPEALLLLGLAACGGEEAAAPASAGGPDGATDGGEGGDGASTLPALDCATEPPVTWENFGQGKLRTHCQGCHAGATPERYGAPDAVAFDTEEDARAWRERIYARTVVDQDMPPAGGLTADELTLFEVFLVCGL